MPAGELFKHQPVCSVLRRKVNAAEQVAGGLLGCGAQGTAGRCLVFTGGPVTEGPGSIVSKSLEEAVRQHKDITKETAGFYKKAKKYYEGLAGELVKNGHVVDIFACALDQVRPFYLCW